MLQSFQLWNILVCQGLYPADTKLETNKTKERSLQDEKMETISQLISTNLEKVLPLYV